MSAFQEIAFLENMPVIHAHRMDDVIIIATRVPLKNMLPDQWGWILSLGTKGDIIDNDDVEALYDNMGRRYPKIYVRSDMFGYIERWGCPQWEPGYSDNTPQIIDNNWPNMMVFKGEIQNVITNSYRLSMTEQKNEIQSLLDNKIGDFLEDAQNNYNELQSYLIGLKKMYSSTEGEIVEAIQSILDEKSQEIIDTAQENYGEIKSAQQEHSAAFIFNRQYWDVIKDKFVEKNQTIITNLDNAMLKQQLFEQKIDHIMEQLQKTILEEIDEINVDLKNTMLTRRLFEQKIDHMMEQTQTTILKELNDQAKNTHESFSGIFAQRQNELEQDLNKIFDKLKGQEDNKLNIIMSKIEDIQKDLTEIQGSLIPIDIEDGNSNISDEITKISKNAKTLSERHMASVINMNTRYYNTVDKEVKESFKQTKFIIYVGVGLLVLTIVSLLVTFFFHSSELAIITSGVGAILAAIATTIGGLNGAHDNTANKQLIALGTLNHTVQATHAQFIIEQVKDDGWKKEQLVILLAHYLTGGNRVDNEKEV